MGASTTPAPQRLGPYELVRRLATGGMAEVYLARRAGPHGFQKTVAVKRILPQYATDPDFLSMFIDEARVCARLAHPNIVQVFDFGEENTELYMAMEYVDGTTGARLIRAAALRGEDVPLEICLYLALSILRALEYAHSARDDGGRNLDLVHRDVSPGNVLIDRSGAVKLTDFGIARAAEIERRTDAGQLKGKLGYMSPEQVVGRELDARSDLFTLGIVLAELVTLRPLFAGGRELDVLMRIRDADVGSLDRAGSRVPDDLRVVLHRALARDSFLRYPNATAFAEAIEEIIRRRRLQVGPSKLAAWIEKLGLIEGTGVDEDVTGETGRRNTSTVETTLPPSSYRESVPPTTPTTPPQEGAIGLARDVAPQIYRVQGADGTTIGPMSYPRLIELFATGKIGKDTRIARERGRFKEPKHFAELGRFVTSPALRWDEEWPAEAFERVEVDRAVLPTRLFRLAYKRETGVLVLRNDASRKKVYLVDGAPEFVASTDKTELLGQYLIHRGQVLRMEVEMALAMLPRFGGRIGDALVGLGVLRPVELFRAIHEQTQHRYLQVMKWQTGELGFVRGVRSHEETFPLGVDPFELIARGVREAYGPDELAAILSPLDEEVIEPVEHPPLRVDALRLPDREAMVLASIDGKTTLDRLVAQASARGIADPAEVLTAVFIGLSFQSLASKRWNLVVTQPPFAPPT
ncbi:MAG: serine/threonine-protein kinase [Polyangiaceae bacterium]